MNYWNPEGAVAVVTGASTGIGCCLTHRLAERGATVLAVARRQELLTKNFPASAVASKTQGRIITLPGDITLPEVRESIYQQISQLGRNQLDLLVNNAGVGAIGPFASASPDRLRRLMEVNFFAPVELTRTLLPLLRTGRLPVICNISSVLGHCAVPEKSEYCASKFALHGWSDSVRAELAAEGIQVTLVSPSTTRSDFFQSLIDTDTDQQSKSFGSWSAEKVADHALAAIESRRREVVLSMGGKALVYADRLLPGLIAKILKRPRYAERANVN
ncbi:SDR family NAD(P)-dependent oxidoreductase [bacterium]|nr:SDR family NAD(P)-dependent oxidoreductase [bacterium]